MVRAGNGTKQRSLICQVEKEGAIRLGTEDLYSARRINQIMPKYEMMKVSGRWYFYDITKYKVIRKNYSCLLVRREEI